VTEASASTIWRWLHEDAIKPWQVRSWIFPRDAFKAGRALDLYARVFEGRRLRPDEYWIVDNGSSHAGKSSIKRMSDAYPNGRLIHLPVHASWLNQAEILFSIVQRKALTPNDFGSLPELAQHLMDFAPSTTATSPGPSNGHSPAPTSTASWPRSPTATTPRSRSPPEHSINYGHVH